MTQYFDIAFVGGGISTSFTLIHLLENLDIERKTCIKIAVVERSSNVFSGIPYGSFSSDASLIITPLMDFLPALEKEKFISWLEKNSERLFNAAKEQSNAGASISLDKWYRDNKENIDKKNFDDICFPRKWFGQYIKHRLQGLIRRYSLIGAVCLSVITAEVFDVKQEINHFFKIMFQTEAGKDQLRAHQVVLAVGSTPMKAIGQLPTKNQRELVLGGAYTNGIEQLVLRVQNMLRMEPEPAKRNLLIVGCNASAIEFLYHLNFNPELFNSIALISSDSSLPMPIGKRNQKDQVQASEMEALTSAGITPKRLWLAFDQDVKKAKKEGYNISDIVHDLSRKMAQLLSTMPLAAQHEFFESYGAKVTKSMRRSGKDYHNAVTELSRSNKLRLYHGRFNRGFYNGDGCGKAIYTDQSNNEIELSEITAVINCSGIESVTQTRGLLHLLRESGLISYTKNHLGFKVNENFESVGGLYIMGPLLGGNINSSVASWHVESAHKIAQLSAGLAASLKINLHKESSKYSELELDCTKIKPQGIFNDTSSTLVG